MASLGRSFKPPAYLRARSRPAMTGRTLSNSSDISVVSTGSRSDADDLLMSGLNTPAYEMPKSGQDGLKMSTAPDLCSPKGMFQLFVIGQAVVLCSLHVYRFSTFDLSPTSALDPFPAYSMRFQFTIAGLPPGAYCFSTLWLSHLGLWVVLFLCR